MGRAALHKCWKVARFGFFLWRYGLHTANQIPTHLTEEEKQELFMLVLRTRPTVAAEIGSYLGCSSSFLAAALRRSSAKAVLYCIDTWQNETMPEGERDTYNEFLRNTKDYETIIQPLRGLSNDIASHFTDKIDLLFIDGDHSYTAVKDDWTQWRKHLNPGACVVMHDIGWATGVQLVVEEQIQPLAATEKRLPNLYWAILECDKLDSDHNLP